MERNDSKRKMTPLEKSVHTLLEAQVEYHQSIKEQLEQLRTQLKESTSGLTQQLETHLKESERVLNSIKQDSDSQSGQISYIEKKIDYVDKTIDLRIKHFDELLKNSQEQYEKNVKNIQDDIRYQIEHLASMETKLGAVRYWYIGVGVIILGLIWVLMFRMSGAGKLGISEIKRSNAQLTLSLREDTHDVLQTITQRNNELLEAIKKNNQEILTSAEQAYQQQLRENRRFLKMLQEDNQHFLSVLQQSNQEHLSAIAELLQAEETAAPAPPVEEGEEISAGEEELP
jgi:hypothetical protein